MKRHESAAQVVERHKNAGKFFTVDGVQTFALDEGAGETVLCIHGVPTSSFLYRKVIHALAAKGYRGVAVDLPGLGLADRPEDFDYSFQGLARFMGKAIKVLGLTKFHLVVHDVGGPVGFALAVEHPDMILSLTILNTWIDVVNFKKPFPMRPFEKPVLGEMQLAAMTYPAWNLMFSTMGVLQAAQIPRAEIDAYMDLLKREDGGKAFLKIMRSFAHTPEFRALCLKAVQHVAYPIQLVWGAEDPFLTFERFGMEFLEAATIEHVHRLKSRHFLQEERPAEIARAIAQLAAATNRVGKA